MAEATVQMRGIRKQFPSCLANDNVDFTAYRGEIHALLGENGAGKSTLMSILTGVLQPDAGEICINGKPVMIRTPKDALQHGIGMIYQHFKLVKPFSVAENIVLSDDHVKVINKKKLEARVKALSERYCIEIDPGALTWQLSIGEQQRVEILKVLYRNANILILDEPTAVLTPQETQKLFSVLRNMRAAGKAVIIITHKLNEVLELSDRVAVLRKGQYIDTVETKDATVTSLTEMMVGKRVELNIDRSEPENLQLRLHMKDVTCVNPEGVITLNHATFDAYGGEILGIAGVAGSGQKELLESIAGLTPTESGEIEYFPPEHKGMDITKLSAVEISRLGIKLSFVPEDRLGMGLVGPMDMVDNMMIRSYRKGSSFWADRKNPRTLAERIIKELEVSTPGVSTPVGKLSGGNVQKVLVGREIASSPIVLMVAYPVRGLDINSSYTIYNLLNEQKKRGVSVLCVGEDLDVLLALCDRILVLCDGKVSGIVDARTATKEQIGLMMTHSEKGGRA